MGADKVADKACEQIRSGKFQFVVLNFANMDMVGHTGIFDAAVKACDTVDSCEIGVRIKTTAERLQKLPSIITGFNRGHIGPVKYINQTVIDRNLQRLQLKNTKEYWDACDKTLFEKREEFSHEQKYRFVFLYTNGDPSYLEVQIKPQDLIDEVTFDPRITKEDFDIQILNN